jgi:hypothetical protein
MVDKVWAIYGQFGKIIQWIENFFVPKLGFAPKHKLSGLTLYHFWGSYYSWKTRLAIYRMRVDIPFRDIFLDSGAYNDLMKFGGRDLSPCLRIENGASTQWIYESADIIAYLKKAKSNLAH